ncbi:type II toxin-antitoxin system MqsA family antitoxin [Anabaena sp. UHCC 0399]|uniref:type II toxin-antitoxin system MqsA family antitoxin n=1 Tax=Anabaena sp. UHCC 0399 TaxID=3110238 RepID=UPI002B1FFC18|nr:type II toxin-antitoxin system MqsA family antitoxin [Anabaena sp. UHCC 0399]MEA5564737.1 type II toxin-antitoxin system MqsA family antitoxin [Anabaena sp. UHCC 0399]
MLCDFCGSEDVKIRLITRTYGKSKDLLVIENIPVITCTYCGESYLTAETLHKIEQIKLNRKKLAVERPVEVASFG